MTMMVICQYNNDESPECGSGFNSRNVVFGKVPVTLFAFIFLTRDIAIVIQTPA